MRLIFLQKMRDKVSARPRANFPPLRSGAVLGRHEGISTHAGRPRLRPDEHGIRHGAQCIASNSLIYKGWPPMCKVL